MSPRRLVPFALVIVLSASARGQEKKADGPEKWEPAIKALEALDKSEQHPDNAVLFIGSSSVRRWETITEDMAPYPAIRRGYGGAKYSDLRVYAKRLTHPHRCRAIAIFVGNDVSGRPTDRSAADVAVDVRAILHTIRGAHPATPVFFIAVTPTERRWEVWHKTQGVNAAIAEICSDQKNAHYISTVDAFLGEDGRPRAELFVADKLHLNEQGYDLWARLIKARLDAVLNAKD